MWVQPDGRTIAFLLEAVADGRLDRLSAHRIVVPWVEGDEEAEDPVVFGGATVLHGLDLVCATDGRLWSHPESEPTAFAFSDEEVRRRCLDWIGGWSRSRTVQGDAMDSSAVEEGGVLPDRGV